MADNKITIEVAVEGNAQVQFKKLSDSAADFASETKKSFLDVGRIFDNFIANIGSNAVSAGINALKSGFSAFNDLLSDAVKQAAAQESAISSLNQSLVSAGKYSKETSQAFQDFAGQIQKTTTFSDDAVISAGALIEQLGRLSGDGLQKATQAAIELSTVFKIDLQSAANLVGKAADGNVSVLSRYGITVKETGDKARDFANALEKINEKYQGSAAAAVNTYSGSILQLKNQYDDLLKVFGEAVVKNSVLVSLITNIGDALSKTSDYVKGHKAELNRLVSEGIILLLQGFSLLIGTTDKVVYLFSLMTNAAKIFLGTIGLIIPGISLFREELANTAKNGVVGLAETVFNSDKTLVQMKASVDSLINSLKELKDQTVDNSIAEEDAKNKRTEIIADDMITEEARRNNAIMSKETEQSALLQSYSAYLIARNGVLANYDTLEAKAAIQRNNEKLKQIKDSTLSSTSTRMQIADNLNAYEKKIDDERYAYKVGILTNLAVLQTAKTKELQVIGKAAAISSTTIATYESATKSYNALSGIPVVGPALGFAAAAAAIAAGLVNVSNIAGVGLATGITQVPSGFQNDTFPARLTSGERVVSAPQNKDLTDFLAGSSGLTAKLDQLIYVLSLDRSQSIMIDGREILTAVQSQVDSGRALNV